MQNISQDIAGSLLYRGGAAGVPDVRAPFPDITSAPEARLDRLYRYHLDMVLARRRHIRLVADELLVERQLGGARLRTIMASIDAMPGERRTTHDRPTHRVRAQPPASS